MKKEIKNTKRHHLMRVMRGVSCKIVVLAIGAFVVSSLNSCKKLIDIKQSTTQLLSESVFTDSSTVQSAIAGLYVKFAPQSGPYNYSVSTLAGFSADELQYVGTTFDSYINNAILSTDGDVTNIWSSSYGTIYVANSIIEGVTTGTGLSATFKNQAIAEARFIRAFCYFYLVNFYGGVPLTLTTNVSQNSTLSRSPVVDVYAQIIADLKFAQSNLPADYSISGGSRTRANKWVATAMLARVYLYFGNLSGDAGNYVNAEAQATALINNAALFGLPADLTKVFTPASTEAIWQLYNSAAGYTWYANTVLPNPVSLVPTYVLNPALVNAFEAGDARKTNWTATLLYNGTTYTYPYKYKSITTGANTEYYTVLRLAEQYLIRAEARAQQNNLTGAQADITAIRQRSGLPAATASTQADLLTAIAKERRIEFNCEWGHRWFDLKRTGTVNTVIGAAKPTFWKPAAALYPIPAGEITLDGNLSQNPGYN